MTINEWAIEHFQWKLSMWAVEAAFEKVVQRYPYSMNSVKVLKQREQRFREVVQGECERPLLLSLPRDCVRLIISDYLFISDSILNDLRCTE